MNKVAKFHKVSFERFKKDFLDTFFDGEDAVDDVHIKEIYDSIKLPKRATTGSAGYDFFAPTDISLNPGDTIKIPTGIRVQIDNEWVLKCYPRSGLGSKYMLVPKNLVPVIDADYFNSDNEGHIFMNMINLGDKKVEVKMGKAFCQGIFVQYGITVDDESTGIRNGGFGSTT